MGWVQLAAGAAMCAVVLFAPGLLIALGLRLRGLALAATAPALGLSAVFLATYAADLLRLRWSAVAPLLVAACLAGVAWLATQWTSDRRAPLTPRARTTWAAPVAVAVAAVVLIPQVLSTIVDPAFFAQEHDNVFQLNAVRQVLDTGVATPQSVAMTVGSTSATGYPSAWHALNALVMQTAGIGVAQASNASLLAVVCLMWPLAAVLATRTVAGARAVTTIAAGFLAATAVTFAMLPITTFGGYPLVLAIAMTPISLAAVIGVAGVGATRVPVLTAGLVFAITAPGLIGAHPSAMVWVACMSVGVVAVRLAKESARWTSSRRTIAVLAFAAYCALVFLLLLVIPTGLAYERTRTLSQAIAESLTGTIDGHAMVLVAALCAVGVAGTFAIPTASRAAAVAVWVLSLTLYVIVAAGPDALRWTLATPWYASAERLAAFVPVTAVPLAALGATFAGDWLVQLRRRRRTRTATIATWAGAAVVIALVLTAQAGIAASVTKNRASFVPTADHTEARLAVDTDARELLDALPEIVPAEDLIANNPWDGSGFAYALTGRRVLLPHQIMAISPSAQEVLDGFATAREGSSACDAVRDLGIGWVLRFEPSAKLGRGAQDYAGLDNLDRSPNVELVERIGTASLYRVTGCGAG